MRLSGWTRLWIVASAVWWAAGAWWLYENFEPERVQVSPAVYPPPRPLPDIMQSTDDAVRRRLEASLERMKEPPKSPEEMLEEIRKLPPIQPMQRQDRPSYVDSLVPITPAVYRDDWTRWLLYVSGVVFAPFAAALAFMFARSVAIWVGRGFSPSKQ